MISSHILLNGLRRAQIHSVMDGAFTVPRAQPKTFPFGMFPDRKSRTRFKGRVVLFIIGTFGTNQVQSLEPYINQLVINGPDPY
jgi:hypothetical protein